MPRILRTREVDEDLWEIVLYIARDNEEAAFRLVDAIDEKLEMLARFPGGGQARPELLPNLRRFPVGRYLIFYRPIDDGIEVLRVLHGARATFGEFSSGKADRPASWILVPPAPRAYGPV